MENKNIRQKEINVPLDVMIDIASIITETEMQSTISGVNANKSIVHLTINYPDDIAYYKRAVENIEAILLEYRHFRFEEEDGDWRDN